MKVCNVWLTCVRSAPCVRTLSRSTSMKTCGTDSRNVLVAEAISGRWRTASRKRVRLSPRKATSRPARSSSMKVTPPDVPMPGIAGGGKEKATPSGMAASRSLMVRLITAYCSSGAVRSSQGFSVMKKNAR